MCVQTIVFNSKFARYTFPYKENDYTGLENLTPLHFVDYGKAIKIMDETHYIAIKDSGKMFFRKAISGKSDALINIIQAEQDLSTITKTKTNINKLGHFENRVNIKLFSIFFN